MNCTFIYSARTPVRTWEKLTKALQTTLEIIANGEIRKAEAACAATCFDIMFLMKHTHTDKCDLMHKWFSGLDVLLFSLLLSLPSWPPGWAEHPLPRFLYFFKCCAGRLESNPCLNPGADWVYRGRDQQCCPVPHTATRSQAPARHCPAPPREQKSPCLLTPRAQEA